jgi:hypothetical protein
MSLNPGIYEIQDRAASNIVEVYFTALVIHNRPCQSELRVVRWVGHGPDPVSDHYVACLIRNWAMARGLYFDVAFFTGNGSDRLLERLTTEYRRRFRGMH